MSDGMEAVWYCGENINPHQGRKGPGGAQGGEKRTDLRRCISVQNFQSTPTSAVAHFVTITIVARPHAAFSPRHHWHTNIHFLMDSGKMRH